MEMVVRWCSMILLATASAIPTAPSRALDAPQSTSSGCTRPVHPVHPSAFGGGAPSDYAPQPLMLLWALSNWSIGAGAVCADCERTRAFISDYCTERLRKANGDLTIDLDLPSLDCYSQVDADGLALGRTDAFALAASCERAKAAIISRTRTDKRCCAGGCYCLPECTGCLPRPELEPTPPPPTCSPVPEEYVLAALPLFARFCAAARPHGNSTIEHPPLAPHLPPRYSVPASHEYFCTRAAPTLATHCSGACPSDHDRRRKLLPTCRAFLASMAAQSHPDLCASACEYDEPCHVEKEPLRARLVDGVARKMSRAEIALAAPAEAEARGYVA